VRPVQRIIAALALLTGVSCGGSTSPTGPVTLRIVFQGATTRRSDLPASALACANAVGVTHIHPSWRGFASVPLQAVPPDRYEMTFTDTPIWTRVTFRINDQNFCDESATGAVTRNVFANDVRLVQNATTPGNGDEAGYALTISARGTISQ
jgi:hypothetical protein